MEDEHENCGCCNGNCPEVNCVPTKRCCGFAVNTTPPKCVRPAPRNRTTCPEGNRYGCSELFQFCPVEPDTFTEPQLAVIERTIVSMMVYFPMYSVLDTFGCSCVYRPYYGREGNCTLDWQGGVVPSVLGAACAKPLETRDCGCGEKGGTGLLRFWTPTNPNECCPKLVPTVDENGEPVLDDEGNPLFSSIPQQMLFGEVEASHPHFTKYGGTPQAFIDFDHMPAHVMAKVVGMLCKLIQTFQQGGPTT